MLISLDTSAHRNLTGRVISSKQLNLPKISYTRSVERINGAPHAIHYGWMNSNVQSDQQISNTFLIRVNGSWGITPLPESDCRFLSNSIARYWPIFLPS